MRVRALRFEINILALIESGNFLFKSENTEVMSQHFSVKKLNFQLEDGHERSIFFLQKFLNLKLSSEG